MDGNASSHPELGDHYLLGTLALCNLSISASSDITRISIAASITADSNANASSNFNVVPFRLALKGDKRRNRLRDSRHDLHEVAAEYFRWQRNCPGGLHADLNLR